MIVQLDKIKQEISNLSAIRLIIETTHENNNYRKTDSYKTTPKGLSQLLQMIAKPRYTYSVGFIKPDILFVSKVKVK